MTPFGLLVAALAAWQAVEVWHHGAIFASARARVQAWPDAGLRGFLAGLLLCPFCLSVWVGTAAAAAVWTDLPTGEAIPAWLGWLLAGAAKLFVSGLAASRLANLASDLTRGVCRTPNRSAAVLPGAAADPPNIDIKVFSDDTTAEHAPLGPDRPA